MNDRINGIQAYSLQELMVNIEKTLAGIYKNVYWIRAEMNKLNYYQYSGHCYPDLVEKKDGKIIAQARAVLWKSDFQRINNVFRQTLNEPLKDGIKILFCAKITFSATHGLSLQIFDIDPNYTLGDLEREKKETIRQLKKEGIFSINKSLEIPVLPKRIAIISVETSKGYKDFIAKIDDNPWKYAFFHMLFPSLLQGDGIIQSITAQLNRIRKVQHHFDVVAIVRGGGGELGLDAYNNYSLAREIALFPLPILTGIGHITNETVVEMVACKNLNTPTDLADFFIQEFHNAAAQLNRLKQRLNDTLQKFLQRKKMQLESQVKLFHSVTDARLREHKNKIQLLQMQLTNNVQQRFREERLRLNNLEKYVNSVSPESVMKRGYSITLHEGKAVKKAGELKPGDTLKTIVYKGIIKSVVTGETEDNVEDNVH